MRVAAELAEFAKGKPPEAPLLFLPPHSDRPFERARERAKIAKTNPLGKIDFHALWTAYVSMVLEAGASVKEA